MNREIKFRGLRTDGKGWVYGYYSPVNIPLLGNMGHFINEGGYQAIEIIPEPVGQYTGLKDKNGKEIYEGDIVRYSKWRTKDGMSPMGLNGWHTGEVYYLDGKLVVRGNESWDALRYANLEVIGNIHEHKNLL